MNVYDQKSPSMREKMLTSQSMLEEWRYFTAVASGMRGPGSRGCLMMEAHWHASLPYLDDKQI
jgi:hypothetical protein